MLMIYLKQKNNMRIVLRETLETVLQRVYFLEAIDDNDSVVHQEVIDTDYIETINSEDVRELEEEHIPEWCQEELEEFKKQLNKQHE
jgi:hypothetical protein